MQLRYNPLYLEPSCGDFLHYRSLSPNTVFVTESLLFLLPIPANHISNVLGIQNSRNYLCATSGGFWLLFCVSLLHGAIKSSACGCSVGLVWFGVFLKAIFTFSDFLAYLSNRSAILEDCKNFFIRWNLKLNPGLEPKCALIVIFGGFSIAFQDIGDLHV